MTRFPRTLFRVVAAILAAAAWLAGEPQPRPAKDTSYVLGPGDELQIWAMGITEISDKPVVIDPGGYIDLPLLGRLRVQGLTVDGLRARMLERLKAFVHEPSVSISIKEFRSQPVSLIGSVKNPGVHQVQGRKTLVEMISLAGGLTLDSGHVIKIVRRLENGRIPLPGAADDPTGQFSVAEVSLSAVIEARNPEYNIAVMPYDVISVPRSELVYVMGEVVKPGGYVLNERETVSVLEVLSMAGGMTHQASAKRARVLRPVTGSRERKEIPLELHKIMAGRSSDVQLQPDDILFVPNNTARSAGIRAAEAAIQLGLGVAIWRR